MTLVVFSIRLGLAFILGAAVGIERQWRQKNAGLRTNTLVAIGSAAFVLMAISIGGDAVGRVASYVVSGIGFLGAGVIMKDGMNVQGLNTAATLWCSAAVGVLSGIGLWQEATVCATAIIGTHVLLRPIGKKLSKLPFTKSEVTNVEYLFTIRCRSQIENHVRLLLMQYLGNDDALMLHSMTSNDNGEPNYVEITAEISANNQQDQLMEKMASLLTLEQDVTKVKWQVVGHQAD